MTAARQLVNDRRLLRFLEEQQRRVDEAMRQGYLLGRADGWQAGHDAAHNEVAADWRQLALRIRRSAAKLYNDLERLRRTPGGAIYQAALERRGHEYTGGPVDWETGRPVSEVA